MGGGGGGGGSDWLPNQEAIFLASHYTAFKYTCGGEVIRIKQKIECWGKKFSFHVANVNASRQRGEVRVIINKCFIVAKSAFFRLQR